MTGMDRKIEQKRWPLKPAVSGTVLAGVLAWGLYGLVGNGSASVFRIDPGRLTISEARLGSFEDFIPVRGNITPLKTVYLDAVEGGRVEKLFVEEGAFVTAGQPVLELSNTSLQLDVIAREAEVTEQLNNLRNTRLALEQNRLKLKSDLVEINYQLKRRGRLKERRTEVFEQGLISRQELDEVVDEHSYFQQRLDVTLETQAQDEMLRLAQIEALESGVAQLERNLVIARSNLDNLIIRTPIDGQLTSLDAEIGESKGRGQRLGQIDDAARYKVTAQIDEFYVTRVGRSQTAEFALSDRNYPLSVNKVYPEVRNGQFEVDLEFTGDVPAGVRRGQTLQIRLELGDTSQALLLARGGFFQDTGGAWAFVVDRTGTYAEKRQLTLGRRNTEAFEVLAGLEAGERVIVSEYGAFADMDRVVFEQ